MPFRPTPEGLPSEATIEAVVHGFYTRIRGDDLLAPIFEQRLANHWQEHMATMVDFWSSVLLTTGRYRGRPLAVHGQLGEITPAMWARWIELFSETCAQLCTPTQAEIFIQRATQIAHHLSRSLAGPRSALS